MSAPVEMKGGLHSCTCEIKSGSGLGTINVVLRGEMSVSFWQILLSV